MTVRLEAAGTSIWERYAQFFRAAPEIVIEWNDAETEARGWLVINSLRGGAAGGGTRMRKGVTCEEVTFLAKAMELKFAFAGPAIGGAKAGIDFDPSDPRKDEVLARWFNVIRPELTSRYGTGGDLNVDEETEVIPHCRKVGVEHPQFGVVRGHLGLEGEELERRLRLMRRGLDQEVDAAHGIAGAHPRVAGVVTGYGVASAAVHLLGARGRQVDETRLLLQGFGCVGGAAALYLARAGVRVVGVIDARRAIVSDDGLSVDQIEEFLRGREGNRLPESPVTEALTVEADAFWDTPADVFVAAAASGLLDDAALDRLGALGVDTIISGANHPFWAEAPGDTRLEQRADEEFAVVADIIASCGTAHAFACQSRSDVPLSPVAVFESIDGTITSAIDETIRRAGSADRGLLAAALELALAL